MTKLDTSSDWKRLFQIISVITLACAVLGGMANDADARKRHRRAQAYTPPYSEMVVDTNSGRVLRAVNPDAPRYPASITKVMTLYLLFEQLEKGRMTLSTPLEVSAFGASQAPSKLGLKPGSQIVVEDAILALVTKSANDVAVTVAENIAGNQDAFAQMMTRKARQLGMSRTTYRNASGLPNPRQVTTARDLVRLGIAIKRDFPQYYGYFKTRSFAYRGANIPNHNRLLGRVEGVDGIKTGYTRASGFNLLTSAHAGNRQIVTVVLGGRSGRARDSRVAQLVLDNLGQASNVASERQVAALDAADASAGDDTTGNVQASSTTLKLKSKRQARIAVIATQETTPAETTPAVAYVAKPELVGPAVLRSRKDKRAIAAGKTKVAAMITVADAKTKAEPDMRWVVSEEPAKIDTSNPAGKGKSKRSGKVKLAATEVAPDVDVTNSIEAKSRKPSPADKIASKKQASGWIIQLAAADNEATALKILGKAKAKQGRVLSSAVAFTEQVQKGDATLWRARFGGFDGDSDAQAACSALKKSGFTCLAQRA
jgi:D-alanyl-D-alanine carboxypeptidase